MLVNLLAKYIGIAEQDVTHLLSESPMEVHRDPRYKALVDKIDFDTLSESMVSSRRYMDEHLKPLVAFYSEKHNLEEFPLSGYMVCNWVVAYMKQPTALPNLLKTHTSVSRGVMLDVLPDVLDLLGDVPQHSKDWQQAFSIVVIPLIAGQIISS